MNNYIRCPVCRPLKLEVLSQGMVSTYLECLNCKLKFEFEDEEGGIICPKVSE